MQIGMRLIQIAAIYMLIAVVLGYAMGVSGNFMLSSVHAHVSLLGWATMALAGIVYILVPRCGQSRLAVFHFWGHNLGLPLMMISLALLAYGYRAAEKATAAGSTLVLASLGVFVVNIFKNGRIEEGAVR